MPNPEILADINTEWQGVKGRFESVESFAAGKHTVVLPECIPDILWCRGCAPTAAAMAIGYYDYVSPAYNSIILGYGRLIDYWQELSEYTDGRTGKLINVPNILDQLRRAMNTDVDGGVNMEDVGPGIEVVTNGYDYNNYCFTSNQTYSSQTGDWCWSKIKSEINTGAGRPFVWSVGIDFSNVERGPVGHSLCAFGYRDDGYVIAYNTWWHGEDEWYYKTFNWPLGYQDEDIDWSYVDTVEPGCGSGQHLLFLDYPNGGECLLRGWLCTVRWWQTSSDINMVQLEYSTDGGVTWTQDFTFPFVGKGGWSPQPGWNSYTWNVPLTLTTTARVRLLGYDSPYGGYLAGDGSKENFTIGTFYTCAQPVHFDILSPDDDESAWHIGDEREVTWISSCDCDSVRIDYSPDTGVNWIEVVARTPDDGSYIWIVPDTPSDSCYIRIYDPENFQCFGLSNQPFTISLSDGECEDGEKGDVDGDGTIDVLDVLAVVNHTLGIVLMTDPDALCRADCNDDDTINILDALGIVNVLLGNGECGPGACKVELTDEAMEFLKSLESYLSGEGYARFMALVKAEVGVPTEYSLAQNYPNPFNPVTSIEYSLSDAAKVKVEVYNLLGQVVDVLVNSEKEAGLHTVQWDASDMASGVYFYKLSVACGQWSATRRMVLMK